MQLGLNERIQFGVNHLRGPCVLDRGSLYMIGSTTEGASSWMDSDMVTIKVSQTDNSVFIYNRSKNFSLVRIVLKDGSVESKVLVRGDIDIPRKKSTEALDAVAEVGIPIYDIKSFDIILLDDTFLKGLAEETDEGAILNRAYMLNVIDSMRRCIFQFDVSDNKVRYVGCEEFSEYSDSHVVNRPLVVRGPDNEKSAVNYVGCVLRLFIEYLQRRFRRRKKVVSNLSVGEVLRYGCLYKVGLQGNESERWVIDDAIVIDFTREDGERVVRVRNNSNFLILIKFVFWDESEAKAFAIAKQVNRPKSYTEDMAEIVLT